MKAYVGTWRITEMETWDQDFVDMEVEGFIRFKENGSGEFQFGLVKGFLNWEIEEVEGKERLEFTWEGSDEMDPASGSGWAKVKGNTLQGRIRFHRGDASGFSAQKKVKKK